MYLTVQSTTCRVLQEYNLLIKGVGVGKKKSSAESKTNKHLTLSYKSSAKGGKKSSAESKTNKHLTLSYKSYLQKRHHPP